MLKLDLTHSNVLKSDLTQLCEGNEGLLPSSSSSLLPGQWSTGNNVRLNVNVPVNDICRFAPDLSKLYTFWSLVQNEKIYHI